MKKFTEMFKATTALLIQAGLSIFTILATFVFPLRVDNFTEDDAVFSGFAKFIMALIIGIMYVLFLKFSDKRHATIWWIACIICMIAGTVLFFSYDSARQNRVNYFDKVFVIGDDEDLTQPALDLLKKNPVMTPQDLMLNFAIDSPEKLSYIWKKEGIRTNRMNLIYTYLTTILFFSLSLLTIIQAIQCQRKRPKTYRSKKSSKVSDSTPKTA